MPVMVEHHENHDRVSAERDGRPQPVRPFAHVVLPIGTTRRNETTKSRLFVFVYLETP